MKAMRYLILVLTAAALHAATLTGRVIEDHSGNALASANVRIGKPGEPYLAADLETGRDGAFQTALPAGDYLLEIVKPNFAATKLHVTLGPEGTQVTARLIRRGLISGRVTDSQGAPIVGANVWALPKPRPGEPLRPPARVSYVTQITDARGEYRLRDLPPGEYVVALNWGASTRAVGSSGQASTPARFGSGFQLYPSLARPQIFSLAGGDQHRNVDFTLLPGSLFTVSGKIAPIDPAPQTNYYWLALVLPEQPGFAIAIAQNTPDGAFEFKGIPTGSYRLIATRTSGARNSFGALLPPAPLFAQTNVSVGGVDVTGLVLQAAAPPPIEFTLRPGAGCPAAATLDLTALDDWGVQLNKQVPLKAGETAKIEGIGPAHFALSAATDGDACYLESPTALDLASASGAPIEIRTAPAGSVRGKLDIGTRAPSGFAVLLAPAEDATALEIVAPDASSRFAFAGLRPGRYRIGAFASSQRTPDVTGMVEFEVRAGSNAEIDLAAPPEAQ